MGKCKFSDLWLRDERFHAWLKPVTGNAFEAYCTLCKKGLKLGTLGVKALESHSKSEKHKAAIKCQEQTSSISQYCSTSGAGASRSSATQSAPTAVDLRTAFGSTPTLKAEVLWTFHTITKHQSYTSNEGIDELFQNMFPDSEIAKTFKCGKDKTAYIARFGLADYIKRELIAKVKGPFVLMFDESHNQTNKIKQLDLHVRFWEGDRVQSRYLGSQFMGHATAQDLLKHVKVSNIALHNFYLNF